MSRKSFMTEDQVIEFIREGQYIGDTSDISPEQILMGLVAVAQSEPEGDGADTLSKMKNYAEKMNDSELLSAISVADSVNWLQLMNYFTELSDHLDSNEQYVPYEDFLLFHYLKINDSKESAIASKVEYQRRVENADNIIEKIKGSFPSTVNIAGDTLFSGELADSIIHGYNEAEGFPESVAMEYIKDIFPDVYTDLKNDLDPTFCGGKSSKSGVRTSLSEDKDLEHDGMKL